jgi:hypothetical protein
MDAEASFSASLPRWARIRTQVCSTSSPVDTTPLSLRPDYDGSHRPFHPSSRGRRTSTRCTDTRAVPTHHIALRRELIHTLSLQQYSRVSYTVEHHLQLYYHDPRLHLHFIPSRHPKTDPHLMEDPRHSSLLHIHGIPHSGARCSESSGAVVGRLEQQIPISRYVMECA